jgi:hypothetical protein
MVILEPVLRVRELPPSMARLRQHLPSMRDLVSSTPAPNEPLMIDYLNQGVVCAIFNDRGLGTDALEPRRIDREAALQAAAIMTDGTWVWPGVLPYYLARYHLRLPERFVQFAEARGWKIDPSAIDLKAVDCRAYDSIEEVAVAER